MLFRSAILGYGVINTDGIRSKAIDYGVIETSKPGSIPNILTFYPFCKIILNISDIYFTWFGTCDGKGQRDIFIGGQGVQKIEILENKP